MLDEYDEGLMGVFLIPIMTFAFVGGACLIYDILEKRGKKKWLWFKSIVLSMIITIIFIMIPAQYLFYCHREWMLKAVVGSILIYVSLCVAIHVFSGAIGMMGMFWHKRRK